MATFGFFHHYKSAAIEEREFLPKRDFFNKLRTEATDKCQTIIGISPEDGDRFNTCKYEMMAGLSCVLLGRANAKYGAWKNNVYGCRHELRIVKDNLKRNVKEFDEEKLDSYLEDLDSSVKRFC